MWTTTCTAFLNRMRCHSTALSISLFSSCTLFIHFISIWRLSYVHYIHFIDIWLLVFCDVFFWHVFVEWTQNTLAQYIVVFFQPSGHLCKCCDLNVFHHASASPISCLVSTNVLLFDTRKPIWRAVFFLVTTPMTACFCWRSLQRCLRRQCMEHWIQWEWKIALELCGPSLKHLRMKLIVFKNEVEITADFFLTNILPPWHIFSLCWQLPRGCCAFNHFAE